MRITRHHGHPHPAFVIEGDLHRIRQVGKVQLRSKQFNFVALRRNQILNSFSAFLVFRHHICYVVGFYFRELVRVLICSSNIKGLALRCRPDRLIPNLGHLTVFLLLIRVVVRSKRFETTPINVNTVEHAVFVKPEPAFIFHGSHQCFAWSFYCSLDLSIKSLGQQITQVTIPVIVWQKSVSCVGRFERWVERFRNGEHIQKLNFVSRRYLGHRLGIKLKIRIFGFSVRQITLG